MTASTNSTVYGIVFFAKIGSIMNAVGAGWLKKAESVCSFDRLLAREHRLDPCSLTLSWFAWVGFIVVSPVHALLACHFYFPFPCSFHFNMCILTLLKCDESLILII
jgi:hypothetical protein